MTRKPTGKLSDALEAVARRKVKPVRAFNAWMIKRKIPPHAFHFEAFDKRSQALDRLNTFVWPNGFRIVRVPISPSKR